MVSPSKPILLTVRAASPEPVQARLFTVTRLLSPKLTEWESPNG